MRVGVTGSTGFIGTAVCAELAKQHDVVRLVRRPAAAGELQYFPVADDLSGLDAVIHLAGLSIGDKRWSRARKAALWQSRIDVTTTLSEAVAAAKIPRMVSMSAVGYYGHRENLCREEDKPGNDFLANLCVAWEDATQPAKDAGCKVSHPRMGIALGTTGGALPRMLLPFKFGLGGPMAGGHHAMPWVTRADAARGIVHGLQMEGPYNLAAGGPSQREFAKALGKALHRPAFMPLPGFMVRLMFGEMGQTLLLKGQSAGPEKLLAAGFRFEDSELGPALGKVLSTK